MFNLQKRFKSFLCFCMLSATVGLSGACITWTTNNQEHGVRIGTDIAFYSHSSQTGSVKSETGVESTMLEGLLEKDEPDSTVVVPSDDG